ncbi:MAG TPA: phage Gp37/Gp68 family protein [Anaerolineales bacterium]|nr:phage Gp37/Gp68 family protein [Anaerolineales bacterium]HRQ93371.1 phage Gp37/Gp68 family protein [Anaerolineales bacterium]
MTSKSAIEWTDSTWNPVTGCTKISPGCKNCYAERMARRLKAMGQANYENGFILTLHEHMLDRPLRMKKPQLIFVNSMSDLFHKNVPLEFIQKVFAIMRQASWHQFQVLTKRSERLAQLASQIDWPDNVWMGVSVENEMYKFRIDDLRSTGAAIKFLSLEPLIGPVPNMDLGNIDWVITGGESGPKSREIKREWVVDIKKQCKAAKIPFFFKQWGGTNKKKSGRLLQGRTWDEMPRDMSLYFA